MLDRERSLSTSAVANNGHIADDDAFDDDSDDADLETRVYRTTIVPQPLDDLDSDRTNLHSLLLCHDVGRFDLDEPDISDSDCDEPKLNGHDMRTNSASPASSAAAERAKPLTNRVGTATVTRPVSQGQAFAVNTSAQASRPSMTELPKSDKWYLRVQLDTDCLADLWVRDLTSHNVLVWSEDMETWVPLLTVRELRDAIRDAHDVKTREQLRESNFVFVNTQPPAADQRPLPQPRLPSSSVATPVARRISDWSLPKSRTISNIPPPLLTTAVPIVNSVQPQLAQPQLVPSMSTVRHVVTSNDGAPERQLAPLILPGAARPARMPAIESIAPVVRSVELREDLRVAAHPRTPTGPSLQTQVEALSSLRSVRAAARALLASLPLVHVERFLWLAAGVAVTSATMLIMRDTAERPIPARDGERAAASPQIPAAQSPGAMATGNPVPHGNEFHRVEDLPIVGTTAESTSVPKEKPKVAKSAAVAPAHMKLATAVNAVGSTDSAPSAGGFDTAVARRVLTSSANRASRCSSEGYASGSVIVTFTPSGFVQSASMSGLSGQSVNMSCVLRAFQEARIPPFSGAPVTVRKGFQIL